MKFKEIEPPPQMVAAMTKDGCRSIRAWMRDQGDSMVSTILSEDPSKDDGGYEWHLSVSAVDCRGARYPNKREVRSAMDAAGWLRGSFTTSNGNNHTVHVYRTVKESLTVASTSQKRCKS